MKPFSRKTRIVIAVVASAAICIGGFVAYLLIDHEMWKAERKAIADAAMSEKAAELRTEDDDTDTSIQEETDVTDTTLSYYDYYKTLGDIFYESDESLPYYCLIVIEESGCANVLCKFPEENDLRVNVSRMVDTILLCDTSLADFSSIFYHWSDYNDKNIATYSLLKLNGKWSSPAGFTWRNYDYKNIWDNLENTLD